MVVMIDQDEMDGAGGLTPFKYGDKVLREDSPIADFESFLSELKSDPALHENMTTVAVSWLKELKNITKARTSRGDKSKKYEEFKKNVYEVYCSLQEYFYKEAKDKKRVGGIIKRPRKTPQDYRTNRGKEESSPFAMLENLEDRDLFYTIPIVRKQKLGQDLKKPKIRPISEKINKLQNGELTTLEETSSASFQIMNI